MYDAELDRIVTALGVKPTNGSSLIALVNSEGVQYALADIIEALVLLIGRCVVTSDPDPLAYIRDAGTTPCVASPAPVE